MIITTAQTVEGRKIEKYLGITSAAITMVLPGGNKMLSRAWNNAVSEVTALLSQQAEGLSADAIIAVNYTPFGTNLCATGTAVKLS